MAGRHGARSGAMAVAALIVGTAWALAGPPVRAGSSQAAPVPAFTGPVVDEARLVDDSVEATVVAELLDHRARTGNQIAVAVVRSTGGRSIEAYSLDVARTWALGDARRDNGVLLVVAYDDRAVRLEVGVGLEKVLTDAVAARILRENVTPELREGNVSEAVLRGTRAVRAALGDTVAGQTAPGEASGWPGWLKWALVGVAAAAAVAISRAWHRVTTSDRHPRLRRFADWMESQSDGSDTASTFGSSSSSSSGDSGSSSGGSFGGGGASDHW